MNEFDFWNDYAKSMELSIEGNRLIAGEIAELARALWHRTVRTFDALMHNVGHHRHLPPI
jgi:hypothetical protein